MDEQFDPYLKWFGILPEEQPPNHYRLLGVPLFVDDPEVIGNGADRAMTMLRSMQTGKQSAWSQKLLNEVAQAKVCLLEPRRKTAYDALLRDQAAAAAASAAARPAGPRPRPSTQDLTEDAAWLALQYEAQPAPASRVVKPAAPRRRLSPVVIAVSAAVASVVVIVSLLVLLKETPAPEVAAAPPTEKPSPAIVPAKDPAPEIATRRQPPQEPVAVVVENPVPPIVAPEPPRSAVENNAPPESNPPPSSAVDSFFQDTGDVSLSKPVDAPAQPPEESPFKEIPDTDAKNQAATDLPDQQAPDAPKVPATGNAGGAGEFLFAPSPSRASFAVPPGARSFAALGQCVEDRAGTFVVIADGREIYRSAPLRFAPIRVDLPPGASTVELRVDRLGDRRRNYSCWVTPRFYFSAAAKCEIGSNKKHVKLTELKPTSQMASGGFKINEAPENVHLMTYEKFLKSIAPNR